MLQSTLISTPALSNPMLVETVKSRFGTISIDTSKKVNFPRGLLGMPNRHHFALAHFPSEKMQQFVLMQSLDDEALSFITLPLLIENKIIAANDLRAAVRDVQITEANLAILLIVCVHRQPGEVKLSVNARAPILIDSQNLTGLQYVFPNDLYKVQHMLG